MSDKPAGAEKKSPPESVASCSAAWESTNSSLVTHTEGIIMLLVSILTCGIAAPIMHLFGIIEGILYLTKSDEDFVNTYITNKRAWF